MGTIPALAVAPCPSSFANAENYFGAEGEKGQGHGKQRKDNERGQVEGRGFGVLRADDFFKHYIRNLNMSPWVIPRGFSEAGISPQ